MFRDLFAIPQASGRRIRSSASSTTSAASDEAAEPRAAAFCQELRRLWNQGVLVCVAAGNEGYAVLEGSDGPIQSNMDLSIGDPAKIPLPVDISISADGKGLWVNTFMDGKARYFDLSNPEAPVLVKKIIG